MADRTCGITRRDFLTSLAKLAATAAIAGNLPDLIAEDVPQQSGTSVSRVMKFHNRRILNGLKVNRLRLNSMIDSSVKAFADSENLSDAWCKFIKPNWKVLIKFTQFTGVGPSGEFEMMQAILGSLKRGGFDLGNFAIAGNRFSSYRDDIRPLVDGWSENKVAVSATKEQVRKYLDETDAIINVPNLTDHVLFGVNCAMLNVSEAFIRRPGRFKGNLAHQMIADVCAASKNDETIPPVVLNIVNALRSGYNGGPQAVGAYMLSTSELWLSHDVVALDRLAWQWIDRQRQRHDLGTLYQADRRPDFIALAAQKGLGHDNIDAIKVEPIEL